MPPSFWVPTCLTSCSMPVKLTTMMKKKEMRLQMIRMRMKVRRKMDLVRTVNRKKEKGKERTGLACSSK
ncbi:hypothetical protein SLEP1_g7501 [Rubroshorea leprosula]|uniref:Uncharacterized protein n=1 Tax=Rubroshorea leprosula TaxID=152421 RepID=A0AAV5HYK3_9ROSI|nr:hypothetical protein SLEP1_g7501 [Rubroshorea leprosula]